VGDSRARNSKHAHAPWRCHLARTPSAAHAFQDVFYSSCECVKKQARVEEDVWEASLRGLNCGKWIAPWRARLSCNALAGWWGDGLAAGLSCAQLPARGLRSVKVLEQKWHQQAVILQGQLSEPRQSAEAWWQRHKLIHVKAESGECAKLLHTFRKLLKHIVLQAELLQSLQPPNPWGS